MSQQAESTALSAQEHSCPKSRTFEIFPISWLTPVSLYKPIRYSISLSVGYHPMRLRHRVPITLRCVTPLHKDLDMYTHTRHLTIEQQSQRVRLDRAGVRPKDRSRSSG
uniref:Uncharacterized protein n=1 Tax=Hyaloperonospora arabidopsidis (strain Emoy2) TaxID=559515 RepID=M4BAS5_HYAAE